MKSLSVVLGSLAVLGALAAEVRAEPQSESALLARLEAKIDALAKENVALRERVRKIEGGDRTVAAAPAKQAPDARRPPSAAAVAPVSAPARQAYAVGSGARPFGQSDCVAPRFGGFYVGAHGGYARQDAQRTDKDAYLLGGALNGATGLGMADDGAVAGGQAGYNWARCNTLFGVEVDGSWVSTKPQNSLVNFPTIVAAVRTEADALVTVRARTGVVVDDLLLYVTAGAAAARIKTTWASDNNNFVDRTETLNESAWRWGWTGGVGVEWAWTDRLTLRAEALYVGLKDHDYVIFSPDAAGLRSFKDTDSLWVTRMGLNYRWTH